MHSLYALMRGSHFGESTPLIKRHSSLADFSSLQTQQGFGLDSCFFSPDILGCGFLNVYAKRSNRVKDNKEQECHRIKLCV